MFFFNGYVKLYQERERPYFDHLRRDYQINKLNLASSIIRKIAQIEKKNRIQYKVSFHSN